MGEGSINDLPDEIEGLVEQVVFSGELAKAMAEHERMIEADPEWSTPRWTSVKELVTAFAVGTLQADPYYLGYLVPPNFESVLNYISACAQHDLKSRLRGDLVEMTLIEARRLLLLWGESNPHFMAWNTVGDTQKTVAGLAIVTRDTPTDHRRQFIDLHALVRNAAVFLRDQRRQYDEMNRRTKEG